MAARSADLGSRAAGIAQPPMRRVHRAAVAVQPCFRACLPATQLLQMWTSTWEKCRLMRIHQLVWGGASERCSKAWQCAVAGASVQQNVGQQQACFSPWA